MNTNLIEYKCPCCGGAIKFDSTVQKLTCPYCDTEFNIDALKGYDDDLKAEQTDDMIWEQAEEKLLSDDELKCYICNSCGGEVICDSTTAAIGCPYCDSPIIIKDQISGELCPDLIIPFKLDKKAAKEALSKHLSNKKLLPEVFKNENHLDEIKGIYVPFWLFDTTATAGAHFHATRVRTYTTSKYYCTETSHYSVRRTGTISFCHIPVDASKKLDDELMESIEPFDISEAVEFNCAYLAGHLADRYDVSADESKSRANERISASAEEILRNTVNGYSTIIKKSCHTSSSQGKIKYVLYPVWLLNTTWKDKKYTFAMNGQTGKFVGNLPTDFKKYIKYLLGGTVVFSLISYAVLSLISLL